jgi:hypothetical protein
VKRRLLLRGAVEPAGNDSHKLLDVHSRAVPQARTMARYRDDDEVDLAIVGCGAGGGVLAQRLARKGWRVVVLEKGPFWDPDRDWVSDEAGSHAIYWTDKRIVGGNDPVELGKNNSGHGVGGSMVHYGFRRLLAAQAVDVLQGDATRCGGITGVLRADALCQAHGLPFSAHCSPAVHAPVCAAMQSAIHLEWFHDHVRIERLLFDGTLEPQDGALHPDPDSPGLGIELKRADAERYAR